MIPWNLSRRLVPKVVKDDNLIFIGSETGLFYLHISSYKNVRCLEHKKTTKNCHIYIHMHVPINGSLYAVVEEYSRVISWAHIHIYIYRTSTFKANILIHILCSESYFKLVSSVTIPITFWLTVLGNFVLLQF